MHLKPLPRGQIQIRGNSNVIIYINGKETRRDPATLRYIAAESLEKIEVITNPSAKYDAEGVGGIINLVYKKNKTGSLKLELISNIGILTNPLYLSPNGGINASWSKEKISFFANLSTDYGKYTNFVDSKRSNFNDNLQNYENTTTQDGLGSVSNAQIGFSMEPDSTTSIGLELNFDRWDLTREVEQRNFFDYITLPDQEIILPVITTELENELWVNLSFDKKFTKKKKLNISFIAGGEDETNTSLSDDIDLNGFPDNVQQFLRRSHTDETQRYYNGKIDYETPFLNWGSLEMGAKLDLINYNIFQIVELRSDDITIPNNDFNMDMQKLGLYLIQRKKFKKLEYALGLRMEQFSSDALQKSNNNRFLQDYTRLFPSAQINYLISEEKQTFGINYTRRINRPGFFDLNPFVSYDDPLNLRTGNPALRPEIADLLELNYHQEWKRINLDLTIFQRTTTDAIQSIASFINGNTTLQTSVNIGKQKNKGIEAQFVYRPFKDFKTTNTFTLAQNSFEDNENIISYNQQTNWSLKLRQQWQLKNNWKIELTEVYRAPSYQIQLKRQRQYYMHFTLSKKFNNKKGSLSLSVSDIFNTRDYAESILTNNFEITRRWKWQTRQITLGLRYTIFDKK